MHDNWVACFKTRSRRSLTYGRALTCRSQSSVWSSQRLLHVIPKFETKIFRLVTFVQVNLMSIGKKENLLPMDVTIDRGNLGRGVIRNWDKIHLNVSVLMHDNWVAYFRTWRRRSLFLRKSTDMQKPIQRVKFTELLARHTEIRQKSFARIHLRRGTSSAQPISSKIWGSVSGGDRVARARCPRCSVEVGQKC